MAVLGVSAVEEKVYRYFLRNPNTPVEEIHAELNLDKESVPDCVDRLLDLGMLRIIGGCRMIPTDPDTAIARLADQRLGELHSELQQVTGCRQIADSLRTEQSSRTTASCDVEQLTDLAEIRNRIDDLSFFVREEVLSVEPYEELQPESIEYARRLDLRCLRRGIRLHSIVLRAALDHPPAAAYLRELADQGAQIRVVDETTERILAYDRNVAVVPVDPAETSRGALIAHESGLVSSIVALFWRIWEQAEELPARDEESADETLISATKREVLLAMCSGDKDEAAARSIGVSVRTFRRKLAAVMKHLGADSRAQAALLARERGWI
jgi:DNA-binding CsgD family transcriptional regulator/sugar-specific transcriptional regulator TrmB